MSSTCLMSTTDGPTEIRTHLAKPRTQTIWFLGASQPSDRFGKAVMCLVMFLWYPIEDINPIWLRIGIRIRTCANFFGHPKKGSTRAWQQKNRWPSLPRLSSSIIIQQIPLLSSSIIIIIVIIVIISYHHHYHYYHHHHCYYLHYHHQLSSKRFKKYHYHHQL